MPNSVKALYNEITGERTDNLLVHIQCGPTKTFHTVQIHLKKEEFIALANAIKNGEFDEWLK